MKPFYTISKQELNLQTFSPAQILISDIATALGHICRFGGQLDKLYSVAEHSVNVSQRLPQYLQLAGLLHDASEAYVGDLVGPIKELPISEGYRDLENSIQRKIEIRFGLPDGILHDHQIKEADYQAFEEEREHLIWGNKQYPHINCWSASRATGKFLSTFYDLGGRYASQ